LKTAINFGAEALRQNCTSAEVITIEICGEFFTPARRYGDLPLFETPLSGLFSQSG